MSTGDWPAADGDLLVVGTCQGLYLIEASSAPDYYRPFGIASVVGTVLLLLACFLGSD